MSEPRARTTVALVLVALVALAGCAGGLQDRAEPASRDRPSMSAPVDGADVQGDAALQFGDGDADVAVRDSAAAVQQRARVWTGTVVIVVADFDDARDRIVAAARNRGGYLSDSSSRVHRDGNESWTTGEVVVRVPSEEFDATMGVVEETGTVEASDTSTRDVTDQLVDLEARLESLRTERDRLRELMAGANDTEAVLAVQRELSDVQTEIERLEAKQRTLRDRVAFSTITVRIREPAPGETPAAAQQRWWETGLASAFLESVDGVAVALRALAVGFAYVLPYALVFGLPLVGGYAVLQRRSAGGGSDDTGSGAAVDAGSGDPDDAEDRGSEAED